MVIPPSSPLVTREALQAFTQQLVERFAPEQIILFGSRARGEGRWDSDADILVVMPFRGRHFPSICWCAGPIIREALDHGTVLHG